MPITLNTYTFDPALTSAREDQQELAGQDGRMIRISGVLQGLADNAAIESALDAILAAASDDAPALLSLRAGRQLRVRREKFTREIQRDARIGRFELLLKAEDAFEQSASTYTWPWTLSVSGQTKAVTSAGSAPSPTLITLQATGTLINPTFSDGTRTITYTGVLGPSAPGTITIFDANAKPTVLPEDQVDSTQELELSLMPEDQLKTMTGDNVRDLFAYLQQDSKK